MVKGTSDEILEVIQIAILTVQSEIQSLLNKLGADFENMFGIALH